ncbi:hypothetical protein HDU76_013636 [Blyttiomyces sp. JEL0837]|nr:hypothetical protein HDU76_013636 [Blyttiomyces sp. JEL0837]
MRNKAKKTGKTVATATSTSTSTATTSVSMATPAKVVEEFVLLLKDLEVASPDGARIQQKQQLDKHCESLLAALTYDNLIYIEDTESNKIPRFPSAYQTTRTLLSKHVDILIPLMKTNDEKLQTLASRIVCVVSEVGKNECQKIAETGVMQSIYNVISNYPTPSKSKLPPLWHNTIFTIFNITKHSLVLQHIKTSKAVLSILVNSLWAEPIDQVTATLWTLNKLADLNNRDLIDQIGSTPGFGKSLGQLIPRYLTLPPQQDHIRILVQATMMITAVVTQSIHQRDPIFLNFAEADGCVDTLIRVLDQDLSRISPLLQHSMLISLNFISWLSSRPGMIKVLHQDFNITPILLTHLRSKHWQKSDTPGETWLVNTFVHIIDRTNTVDGIRRLNKLGAYQALVGIMMESKKVKVLSEACGCVANAIGNPLTHRYLQRCGAIETLFGFLNSKEELVRLHAQRGFEEYPRAKSKIGDLEFLDDPDERVCTICGIEESDKVKLLACASCRSPLYCGKDCQKKHWKQSHKAECASLKLKREVAEMALESLASERNFTRVCSAVGYCEGCQRDHGTKKLNEV